tara:strand:- start:906 stop:1202 length:297 start_codon:yes stop_codon:yes gene_type:complete
MKKILNRIKKLTQEMRQIELFYKSKKWNVLDAPNYPKIIEELLLNLLQAGRHYSKLYKHCKQQQRLIKERHPSNGIGFGFPKMKSNYAKKLFNQDKEA